MHATSCPPKSKPTSSPCDEEAVMVAVLLIVAGAVVAVAGVALVSIPAALVVAGVAIVGAGLDLARGDA